MWCTPDSIKLRSTGKRDVSANATWNDDVGVEQVVSFQSPFPLQQPAVGGTRECLAERMFYPISFSLLSKGRHRKLETGAYTYVIYTLYWLFCAEKWLLSFEMFLEKLHFGKKGTGDAPLKLLPPPPFLPSFLHAPSYVAPKNELKRMFPLHNLLIAKQAHQVHSPVLVPVGVDFRSFLLGMQWCKKQDAQLHVSVSLLLVRETSVLFESVSVGTRDSEDDTSHNCYLE